MIFTPTVRDNAAAKKLLLPIQEDEEQKFLILYRQKIRTGSTRKR